MAPIQLGPGGVSRSKSWFLGQGPHPSKSGSIGHTPVVLDCGPEGHIRQGHKAKLVFVVLLEAPEVWGLVICPHFPFKRDNLALAHPARASRPAPQDMKHSKFALLVDDVKVGTIGGFRCKGGLQCPALLFPCQCYEGLVFVDPVLGFPGLCCKTKGCCPIFVRAGLQGLHAVEEVAKTKEIVLHKLVVFGFIRLRV